jgi:hypothetical protein
LATDAFFKPARIFNELDLFQRDPGWLAAFPDGCDETTIPRGEVYVSIVRERRGEQQPGDKTLWTIHADQWVTEDEHRPAVPAIPPSEILSVCMPYDRSSTGMGVESEPGAEEGSVVFYTWAELRMTPAEAKELLRTLCTRFQAAYPDREDV